MEALKKSLIAREEEGGFEVEEQNGVLNILFDDPPGEVCDHSQYTSAPGMDFRAFHQLQAGLVGDGEELCPSQDWRNAGPGGGPGDPGTSAIKNRNAQNALRRHHHAQ